MIEILGVWIILITVFVKLRRAYVRDRNPYKFIDLQEEIRRRRKKRR